MYKRFFAVAAPVVWFYCAVFGVLQEAVCCLFPARLCKQACRRARNKPTPPKRRLPKTECVKHTFSHCWDIILTFPPQPLPLAKGGAWSQSITLLQGGANEPLCVIYSLSVNRPFGRGEMLLRIKGFLLWRVVLCGFRRAVFGVLHEAVCCLFPSRLYKHACCRARNKPIVDR